MKDHQRLIDNGRGGSCRRTVLVRFCHHSPSGEVPAPRVRFSGGRMLTGGQPGGGSLLLYLYTYLRAS